jgi:hypothetical protein
VQDDPKICRKFATNLVQIVCNGQASADGPRPLLALRHLLGPLKNCAKQPAGNIRGGTSLNLAAAGFPKPVSENPRIPGKFAVNCPQLSRDR